VRSNAAADTATIRDVYEGVQRQFYELFMGRQIHLGGAASSIELADAAGIAAGQRGVELCCGSGASMRLLVRLFDVAAITGIELAGAQVNAGTMAAAAAGLTDRLRLVVGDAIHTDLPPAEADFVWGEDAWCYVPDKRALLAEAWRLLHPGGVVAFTDWVEGPARLSDEEAHHVMGVMTFPNLQSLDGYRVALEAQGFDVVRAEDTGRLGPSFSLYVDMLQSQLLFDALELFDFSRDVLAVVLEQLTGLSRLGHAGQLVQGRFVARKPGSSGD
jgi:SAM-dependent methyltransferase